MNRGMLALASGCTAVLCVAGGAWVVSRASAPTSEGVMVRVSETAQPEGMEPTPEQMLEMMEAESKPGPEHARLQPFVGDWNAEMNFLTVPGGEPEVSYGTAKSRWVLGDKFVHIEFEGRFSMLGKEFAFTGMGLMGFDRARGAYTMVWADSLASQTLFFTGRPGDNDKEVTLTGEMFTPSGPAPAKYVYRIESDDRFVLEFWQGVPGSEEMMKVGWITHTRKPD